jgi:hypothetical protein
VDWVHGAWTGQRGLSPWWTGGGEDKGRDGTLPAHYSGSPGLAGGSRGGRGG